MSASVSLRVRLRVRLSGCGSGRESVCVQPREDEMYDDEALQGGKLELGLGRVIRYHSEQAPIPFAIVERERHLATAILRHHSFRFGHGNQRTASRARGDGRLHTPCSMLCSSAQPSLIRFLRSGRTTVAGLPSV